MLFFSLYSNLSAWQETTRFLRDMKARDLALLSNIRHFEQAPESEIPEIGWWISKQFLREMQSQRISAFADPLTDARVDNGESESPDTRSQTKPNKPNGRDSSQATRKNAEKPERGQDNEKTLYQQAIQNLIGKSRKGKQSEDKENQSREDD